MSQVDFRCWYCNKRYVRPAAKAGERLTCSCKQTLRVPRRSGGRCRVKRPVDHLVEAVVYGGGCALAGLLVGLFVVSRGPLRRGDGGVYVVAALTVGGLLVGTFGGEPAVNFFGSKLRERTDG